jgi:hypothetical protein
MSGFEDLKRNTLYHLLGNNEAAVESERADAAIEIAEVALAELKKHKQAEADLIASAPPLTKESRIALLFMYNRRPQLCTHDNFDEAKPSLSRATATSVVKELISAGLAHRPNGPRKGATLTEKGLSLAAQLMR